MDLAQRTSSLVHSLRKKHNLRVRQPLSRVLIPALNEEIKNLLEPVKELILAEVNIKKLEFLDDASGILVKKIKPNFKALGKKAGAQMKDVTAAINAFTKNQIAELEKTGNATISILNSNFLIQLEDVEILSEDIPGWVSANEGGLTVALDISLTNELKQEGIARDVVNRIQNLRKDSGLEVQDKIKLTFAPFSTFIDEALVNNKEYICNETQALDLFLSSELLVTVDLDMDEFTLKVKLEVV